MIGAGLKEMHTDEIISMFDGGSYFSN